MSINKITTNSESRMQKAIDNLRKEYSILRAGRATPSLLERIMVDYYGTPTPVNQVANISIPEPRMILVKPWEKTMLGPIEKAIQKSDLGITPNNDGESIRLNIPQLTNERRKELCKIVNKKAEENRVAIRNIRRDANDAIKKLEKDKAITEDDSKKSMDNVQKITDKYIEEINTIMTSKEKEIMEV